VGVSGIIVEETENTFQLAGKDNKFRRRLASSGVRSTGQRLTEPLVILGIPKAHSIFSFTLNGLQFSLYGSHIWYVVTKQSVTLSLFGHSSQSTSSSVIQLRGK
jgi:RNase P/RNase MRP subunit p29